MSQMCWSGPAPTYPISPSLLPGSQSKLDVLSVPGTSLLGTASWSHQSLALHGNCSITNSPPMLGLEQLLCSWRPAVTSVALIKNLRSPCSSNALSLHCSGIGFRLKGTSGFSLPAPSLPCGTLSLPILATKLRRVWEPSSSLPSSAFGRSGIKPSSTTGLLL